jgi:hypothetical protein
MCERWGILSGTRAGKLVSHRWAHQTLLDGCDCLFAMEKPFRARGEYIRTHKYNYEYATGACVEGHVSWDYEANGRINTQLGVCDRYVRSEAGARITGQCARDKYHGDKYHGTSITGQVSRDKYHGDNGQKIMKCTHYFLWVFAYIFHYIRTRFETMLPESSYIECLGCIFYWSDPMHQPLLCFIGIQK